jgi:uncharacterized protein YhaN
LRLTGFDIDGFGVFHDISLKGLPSGLALFLGDNEAGKSTLLAFFRSVLFGFPDKRSKERAYPPIVGGNLGGRIGVMTRALGEVVVERRAGPHGGNVSVYFPDGTSASGEGLRVILGGTTSELFKNVYAFSLGELQTFESLNGEAVKGALYGASAGAGMLLLPKAQSEIDRRLEELFRPRGNKPLINGKLSELEEIRNRLKEASALTDRYEEAQRELREIGRKREGLRADVSILAKDIARAETYLKLWDDWVSLSDIEERLRTFPHVVEEFPEEGVQRLDRLLERLDMKQADLSGLETDLRDLHRQAGGLVVDEALLSCADTVRRLLEGKAVYAASVRDLGAFRQELQGKREEIKRILGGLGNEWTEGRVLAIDRSLFAREAIAGHGEVLRSAKAGLEEAGHIEKIKQDELKTARLREDQAGEVLAGFQDLGPEGEPDAVRALEAGRSHFAALVRDFPQREKALAEARRRLEQAIGEIDSRWGKEEITRFDCSVPARELAQSLEDRIIAAEGLLRASEARAGSRLEELERARARLGAGLGKPDKASGMAARSRTDLVERKASVRALGRLVVQREYAAREIRDCEARLTERLRERDALAGVSKSRPEAVLRSASIALICVGVVLAAWLCLRIGAIPEGVFFGVASVSAGGYLFRRAGRERALADEITRSRLEAVSRAIADIEAGISGLREKERGLSRQTARLEEVLGVSGGVSGSDLDALETEIEQAIAAVDARERHEAELEEARKDVTEKEQACQALVEERDRLAAELEAARDAWTGYVAGLGLRDSTGPRTVGLVFAKVEAAKSLLQRVGELDAELRDMDGEIRGFLDLAGSVAELSPLIEEGADRMVLHLETFFERRKVREDRIHERRLAEKAFSDAEGRRVEAEEGLEAAHAALDQASETFGHAQQAWREWLGDHGLPEAFSPAVAAEALQRIEQCVILLNECAQLEQRIRHTQDAVDSYLEISRSLFDRLERPEPGEEMLFAAIETLAEGLKESRENLVRKEQSAKAAAAIQDKMEVLETEIRQLRAEWEGLLQAGGARDQEEFRKRGRWYEERKGLREEIGRLERNLRTISGDEDMDLLRSMLTEMDREDIRAGLDESSRRLREIERELEAVYLRQAELGHELGQLASSEEISRLLAEEEKVLEEIRVLAGEWGRYAIARYLIGEAKGRFEREQQPKVIQDASGFFRTITGGRYERIMAPLGGGNLQVIGPGGTRKTPDELSRGTAEQLYLALRFGYIANYSVNGEGLPVIMDDILVNFDPVRAEHAVQAIRDVAERHQVLFFTCHPGTVRHFRKHIPGAALYRFCDGRILPDQRGE